MIIWPYQRSMQDQLVHKYVQNLAYKLISFIHDFIHQKIKFQPKQNIDVYTNKYIKISLICILYNHYLLNFYFIFISSFSLSFSLFSATNCVGLLCPVELLSSFLSDRLADHHSLQPPALHGLAALVCPLFCFCFFEKVQWLLQHCKGFFFFFLLTSHQVTFDTRSFLILGGHVRIKTHAWLSQNMVPWCSPPKAPWAPSSRQRDRCCLGGRPTGTTRWLMLNHPPGANARWVYNIINKNKFTDIKITYIF